MFLEPRREPSSHSFASARFALQQSARRLNNGFGGLATGCQLTKFGPRAKPCQQQGYFYLRNFIRHHALADFDNVKY